jgi:hypothetical protein
VFSILMCINSVLRIGSLPVVAQLVSMSGMLRRCVHAAGTMSARLASLLAASLSLVAGRSLSTLAGLLIVFILISGGSTVRRKKNG